mgnify:CR=1 FL=1
MSLGNLCISILIAIFQSFAATETIFKQLPNNKSKRNKMIFNLIICIYCIISFFFVPNQLRFILCILIITATLYFVLGIRDKVVILYSFNTEIILAICEIIVTLLMVVAGFDSTKIVNLPKYNLLANVFISTLSIIIVNISFFQKLLSKEIDLFKRKNLTIYLYIFLVLLYLIVSKNGLELILESNYYINFLFLIIMIIVITIIIKNDIKAQKINDENKLMLNYVTKYENIITQQGKANHEFKNQLMVIRGYAQMNSSKLIEYIDSIVEDSRKTYNSHKIVQLNKFPDGGIKGLLYYKLSTMDDEKIKYELNVETGVKTKLNNLSINMYKNITKILGVLLDNAIDASKKTKDKKVIINVTQEKTNVIFVISNTYQGNIDLTKIGTGYTTKGQNHGYGLRLIKDITEASSIFNIKRTYDEKFYCTEFSINIKKNKNQK